MQLEEKNVYSAVVISRDVCIAEAYVNQIGSIYQALVVGNRDTWDMQSSAFFDTRDEAQRFILRVTPPLSTLSEW